MNVFWSNDRKSERFYLNLANSKLLIAVKRSIRFLSFSALILEIFIIRNRPVCPIKRPTHRTSSPVIINNNNKWINNWNRIDFPYMIQAIKVGRQRKRELILFSTNHFESTERHCQSSRLPFWSMYGLHFPNFSMSADIGAFVHLLAAVKCFVRWLKMMKILLSKVNQCIYQITSN